MLWAILNSLIDTMDKHFQDLRASPRRSRPGAVCALLRLHADGAARRTDHAPDRLQGRHHLRLILVALGGLWFVPATSIAKFLGVPAWRVRGRDGPHRAGDRGESLYDGARPEGIRHLPHQPRAILQRLRLDHRTLHRVLLLLRDDGGAEAANKTLYIPYLIIAIFVLVLVVLFCGQSCPRSRGGTITTPMRPRGREGGPGGEQGPRVPADAGRRGRDRVLRLRDPRLRDGKERAGLGVPRAARGGRGVFCGATRADFRVTIYGRIRISRAPRWRRFFYVAAQAGIFQLLSSTI